MPTWSLFRTVESVRHDLVEDVVDQRTFPRAGHPGHRDEHPQREIDVHVDEVVGAGTVDRDETVRGPRTSFNSFGHLFAPGQERSGVGFLLFEEVRERTRVHDFSAVFTRPGADVDDPVGSVDGVLVVFDHDQSVPDIAQAHERFDQSPIVALV